MMCCAAAAFFLVACHDDEPEMGEPLPPSAVDGKDWDFDAHIDAENYSPGDNFYMYCIGMWHKNADLGGESEIGLVWTEMDEVAAQRFKALDDPTIEKFSADAKQVDQSTEAAEAIVEQRLAELANFTTTEEGWLALAKSLGMGYDNVLCFTPFPNNGKIYLGLDLPDGSVLGEEEGDETEFLSKAYARAGESPESARRKADHALRLVGRLREMAGDMNLSAENLRKHPELREGLRPLVVASSTRGVGEGLAQTLVSTLGLDPEYVMVADEMKDIVQWVEGWSVEDLKRLMEYSVMEDYKYTSSTFATEEGDAGSWNSIVREAMNDYMSYPISHDFGPRYVSPELKERFEGACEELKEAFGERLADLDWMSETTKQNAMKKLEVMKVNVGYPDEWLEEGLPELSGATFLEDVMQLRESRFALVKAFQGQDSKQMSFHLSISEPGMSLLLPNCFYYRDCNAILIYPAFMLPPFISEDISDAYAYASFAVIGHEITHGFDNLGANFDKDGNYRNWWTVMDKMAFTEKCQSLVNCYNLLEIMPDELPGVYCDGENTLGENIADLGGVEVAHQAYVKKLEREGFYGEEREKQERRFYQGWAEVWRSKYTAEIAEWSNREDIHALPKERVNGVVMNCDRWYELFDVQWGDMLYLSPELRTHIW